MASNLDKAKAVIKLLASHGVTVTKVSGWETRKASTTPLVPEGCVVHHTGDKSTPLSILRDGRKGLPGNLADWFVGQSGNIYLIGCAYSNNAGYGGEANFAKVVAGPVSGELTPPAKDGDWSANRHAWGIEADGVGAWEPHVRKLMVQLLAAIHIVEGWTWPRVIAHKELTRRKPGDPGDNMAEVRAEVAALIKAWSSPVQEPEPAPAPTAFTEIVLCGNTESPVYSSTPSAQKTKASIQARAKAALATGATLMLVQECPESVRDEIRSQAKKATGHTWLTWPHHDQAILFDTAVWRHDAKPSYVDLSSAKGAVIAYLTHIKTGKSVRVCSVHMPTLKSKGQPNGYADNAARLKDIKLIAVKASSNLAIFGGDFNTAEHRKTLINNGWTPALAAGKDTYDDPGVQAIDGLFTKGLAITDAKVIDPGKASDHKWITAQIRIG